MRFKEILSTLVNVAEVCVISCTDFISLKISFHLKKNIVNLNNMSALQDTLRIFTEIWV